MLNCDPFGRRYEQQGNKTALRIYCAPSIKNLTGPFGRRALAARFTWFTQMDLVNVSMVQKIQINS